MVRAGNGIQAQRHPPAQAPPSQVRNAVPPADDRGDTNAGSAAPRMFSAYPCSVARPQQAGSVSQGTRGSTEMVP